MTKKNDKRNKYSSFNRTLDKLFNPKVQAIITLTIAISFSIIVLITTVIPYATQPILCKLGGGCIVSLSSNNIKVSPCNDRIETEIYPSSRYPISFGLKDKIIPLLTYPLLALDSMGTTFSINNSTFSLNDLSPYATICNNCAKLIYKDFNYRQEEVKLKTLFKNPNIVIVSEVPISSVGLKFGGIIDYYSWNSTSLIVHFTNKLLNFQGSLMMVTTCPIESVEKIAPDKLVLGIPDKRKCDLILKHVNITFNYYVLSFHKKDGILSPSLQPVLVKVHSKSLITLMKLPSYVYLILPYSIYLMVLIIVIIIVIRTVIKSKPEDLGTRRVFYSYLLAMTLFGSLVIHWWDGIQTWIFAGQSPDAAEAYLYTYYQLRYSEVHEIPHIPQYAGYTYPLPWLIYLLYPLRLVLSLIGVLDHSFLAFQSRNSFFHPYFDYVYLVPEMLLTTFAITLYYLLFAVLAYEEIRFLRDEELLRAYTMFMYTPYAVSIIFVWKMFEGILLPILVLFLATMKKMTTHRDMNTNIPMYVIMGLAISIVITKAYPIIIVLGMLLPFFYYRRKTTVSIAFLSTIFTLLVLFPIISTIGIKRYFYATFVYQSLRVPYVINVFNSILYPSLPYHEGLFLRKLDLVILGLILLLQAISLLLRFRKCHRSHSTSLYEISILSSISLFSVYLVFSPVVSPQNYLFLVFLSIYITVLLADQHKSQSIKRLTILMNFFLFIFVLFIYPGFAYFGYPLGEIAGILPQTSYTYWIRFLISFIGRIISAFLYPLILTLLILLSYFSQILISKLCRFSDRK